MVKDFNTFWDEISEKNREELRLYSRPDLANYFDEIARKLMGDEFYDKYPLPWAISEEKMEVNAAFCDEKSKPFFCIWRGLLDLLDNEDQLAYIMGHELEHYHQAMLARDQGEKPNRNSKAEEATADVTGIFRMAKAGYNINEALTVINKFRELVEKYQQQGEREKANKLSEYLKVLDPHPQDNQRRTINEIAVIAAREKLAAGEWGKEIDDSKIPLTELPEELHQTDYVSYIDRRFKDAKFDEMTTEEKNKFLVNMCVEVASSPFKVRREDFKRHVDQYLDHTLQKEMSALSWEERKESFEKGTAPAMTLVEEFLKVELEMYDENPEGWKLQDLDSFYLNTLGNAVRLWAGDLKLEESTPFWRNLKKRIETSLEKVKNGKRGAPGENPEGYKEAQFLYHLEMLFEKVYGDKLRIWQDLPVLDYLKVGDPSRLEGKIPSTDITSEERKDRLRVPRHTQGAIGCLIWSPDDVIHKIVKEEAYDHFVMNADGSIVASKVLDQEKRIISDMVGIYWESDEKFLEWQKEFLKVRLHEKIVEDLRELRSDEYDMLDYKKRKLSPNLALLEKKLKEKGLHDYDPLYKKTIARALALEDISDVVPDWKYVPVVWENPDIHSRLNVGIELDKDLLLNLMRQKVKGMPHKGEVVVHVTEMPSEEERFWIDYQKEYVDRLTDTIIEKMKEHEEWLWKKYKKHIPFPSECLGRNDEVRIDGIQYQFLPYQLERVIAAWIDLVPATEEELLSNSWSLRDAYNTLFKFYDYKQAGEKERDFSEFKSPIIKYIAGSYGLPEFSYKNASAYQAFVKRYSNKNLPLIATYPVFDAIIHNKGEQCPLSLVKDIMIKIPAHKVRDQINSDEYNLQWFRDDAEYPLSELDRRLLFNEKIVKLCQDEKNWSQDLVEFSDTVYWFHANRTLTEENAKDVYDVVKNGFLKRLEKEKDIKKIEEGWLLIGNYLSSEAHSSDEYDTNIVPLFAQSPIWKQDIKSKVDFLVKVPENFWGSNSTIRDDLTKKILEEIGQIKAPKEREGILFELLKTKGRIAEPDLLDQAQKMWAKSVFEIMGKIDDESEAYLKKIKPYIDKIKETPKEFSIEDEKNTVAEVDKTTILRYLAEEVVSQKRLSQEIKPDTFSLEDMTGYEKNKRSLELVGADLFGKELRDHPERRDYLIDFLRSKGTPEDCKKLRSSFYPKFDTDNGTTYGNLLRYAWSVPRLQQQYKSFWRLSSDYQAVIVDSIFKNSAEGFKDKEKKTENRPLWEQNFDYVAGQIFPGNSKQTQSLKTALHAYLESRPESDRNLGLAKLLVASGVKSDNENEEDANQKLGKGIKTFLESIGPAGIKLGQALSAVPDIPDYIRDSLKDFTSNAARPARWEIYDWLENYKKLKQEEIKKAHNESERLVAQKEIEEIDALKLGKILGSASFFVTMDSGKGEVVKLLRLAAQVKAEQEMRYIYQTLEKLSQDDAQVLGDLGPTLQRIVKQAKESIQVETDMAKGKEQYQLAKKLYPEIVTVNGITFNVKEADWKQCGEKYARLEKMEGVEVDKLQDPEYRKAASIAYFSVELLNVFSGKQFDFDRHIGQMKINEKTNTLGLFDTGSMLLEEPGVEDQKALGTILYRTLENALDESHPKTFASALTEEIDRFYKKSKQPTAYITQVQRGLLALSGYYKDFSAADFAQCIDIAFNNPDVLVSGHIMSSFVSEMLEKTGLFDQKSTTKVVPEQIAAEKESLGRLMFNLYAASQVSDSDASMGEILEKEHQIQKQAKVPVLGRVFLQKKGIKNDFGDIKIPRFFGVHIVKALRDKQIDPIIAKGMMKEAFDSICLIDKNNRDTPQVKRELGKQLYSLFISAKKQGKSSEEIKLQTQQKLKDFSQKSVLARNLCAILALSGYTSSDQQVDLKEVIWDIMSQKDLDKDVLKGIQASMKENGQTFASMALHLRRPLSQIRKIRNVFSLFKKDEQKGYLRSLLEKAKMDVMALPKKLVIRKTSKGKVLRLLSNSSAPKEVPLADKNRAISYGGKRSTYGGK